MKNLFTLLLISFAIIGYSQSKLYTFEGNYKFMDEHKQLEPQIDYSRILIVFDELAEKEISDVENKYPNLKSLSSINYPCRTSGIILLTWKETKLKVY